LRILRINQPRIDSDSHADRTGRLNYSIEEFEEQVRILSPIPRTSFCSHLGRQVSAKLIGPLTEGISPGDFDAALRYNLDGIMNRHGAFEKFPGPVRTMVKENERTVGELMAEVPPSVWQRSVQDISA